MTSDYAVIETVPSAEDFCRLRRISGMSPRPLEGVIAGLPRSCYGVHILWQGIPVGMGRLIMENIVRWLDANAFQGAYVSLVADVPELYAKFGFTSVRPASDGMAKVW